MQGPVGVPDCTLVIPTYNAAAFIGQTVERLRVFLQANPRFRVLFVCDGCTDGTAGRLQNAIGEDEPFMAMEDYADNRGKGFALKRGLTLARTPYLFFLDADLAYGPEEALKLLALLEAGASLAVVNRADPRSEFIMSPCDFPTIYRRHLMSRAFNWWLRQVLPIRILDTQAGLKGLTGDAWAAVAESMRSIGFFFDVELLARVEAAGMPVAQTPVVVRYQDPTTVRMLVHGWSMLIDGLRLRGELRCGRREARASSSHLENPQHETLPRSSRGPRLNAGIALVVTADDFGLGPATSQGIIRAHLDGPVTATSMMAVTGDRCEASAQLLAEAPRLEVGLHLVLTGRGEKPFRDRRGSGLIGRDGRFLTLPRLLLAALSGRLDRTAVRDEITAQAEGFGALVGRPPAYVDGHHHAHELPVVREAVIDLMDAGLLPRVTRTTRLLPGTARTRPATLVRQAVANSLGSAAAKTFRSAGVFSNDYFFGMLDEADWAEPFPWCTDLRKLSSLPPGCVVEWVVHPGLPDDSWAGRDPYVRRRPMELAALTNPAFAGLWSEWRSSRTTKTAALGKRR